MSNVHPFVRLVNWPFCVPKLWTLHANFTTNFFHTAMLIGDIDFYHSIPLPITLTVPGDHKVSTK